MKQTKTRVLFVGSFQKPATKAFFGGMMYASTSLVDAEAGLEIDWIKLDTTARSNKGRWKIEVVFQALLRMLKYSYLLLFKRPDTVLLFCSHSASFIEKGTMALGAKFLGKRTVLAPRSGLIKNNLEKSKRFEAFLRRVLRKVDVLICQSESWRNFYSEYVTTPSPNLVVQPNWIDLKAYQNDFHIAPSRDAFSVLFLGWITQNKGVFDLFTAAEILRNDDVKFLLGGDGDVYKQLMAESEKKGLSQVFKLLGWVHGEQKMQFLREADLFILPSYREGYPNAILEAMAMGKTVIATRVGAIPDLIKDGENGLLVDPAAPDQIVMAIRRLKANPSERIKMGKAARQTLEKNNDLKQAVVKMRHVLRNQDQ